MRFQPEFRMAAQGGLRMVAQVAEEVHDNYNWVVGFGAALLLYWGLTAMSAGRSRVPQHAYAGDR